MPELESQLASAMYEDGYVILRGVVPEALVDEALREINSCLGERLDPNREHPHVGYSQLPEIMNSEVVLRLLTDTPAWGIAEAFAGEWGLRFPQGAQIAMRFPSRLGVSPPAKPPHIDGFSEGNNGVKPGEIYRFMMQAHILLSALPVADSGNYTVWPGSHRRLETYFREFGSESLRSGMPAIDYGSPVQITGRRGDVVINHYQLAHAVGRNVSPHIRYGVFIRLWHIDHDPADVSALGDIWREWAGLRSALPKSSLLAAVPGGKSGQFQDV